MTLKEMPYLFERETAFYGYPPHQFTDAVVDGWNRIASEEVIQQHLEKRVDELLGEDCLEAEQGLQKAATLLESALDKAMDRWELYCLRMVFPLPPHTPGTPSLLPYEDKKPLGVGQGDLQLEAITQRLSLVRQQLQQSQAVRQKMESEVLPCVDTRIQQWREFQTVLQQQQQQQSTTANHHQHPQSQKDLVASLDRQCATMQRLMEQVRQLDPNVQELAVLKQTQRRLYQLEEAKYEE